ncbi:hypothetical protein Tco_0929050 [Tanacetum coccineum]
MGEEFKVFEPIGTRTDSSCSSASSDSTSPLSLDHLLTHVSPTPTPTRVSFYHRTTRMAVCTQLILSPGMSARIAEAAALSPSSFYKSLGDEVMKRIWRNERQGVDDECQCLDNESTGLRMMVRMEGEEGGCHLLGQSAWQIVSVVNTAAREPLVFGYGWRVYTDILTYVPPVAPVQTPPSPEWSLGYLPVSPSSPIVPSLIASPVATPTAIISFGRRAKRGAILTFGALWRPVLALEAWAGHVDAWMADMSWARYDDHKLIHDMLVQQAAMQRELQEMRGRVTTLEYERVVEIRRWYEII